MDSWLLFCHISLSHDLKNNERVKILECFCLNNLFVARAYILLLFVSRTSMYRIFCRQIAFLMYGCLTLFFLYLWFIFLYFFRFLIDLYTKKTLYLVLKRYMYNWKYFMQFICNLGVWIIKILFYIDLVSFK